MAYRQSHTTTVDIEGVEYEVEVSIDVAPAEPDVGIMGSYIDDWEITSVDGETSKEAIDQFHKLLMDEYGEEAFVDKLHGEDAAEVDYDDYPEYDDD